MITAEKAIIMTFRVNAKSREMLDDVVEKIRADFLSVLNHYEKESTEELKIYILQGDKCAYCGKLPWDCQCGRPAPRPSV